MSTPNPLTYGDTFTLPSAPGTTWQIIDLRDVDHAGETREDRATAWPVHVAEDGTMSRYRHGEPVKIGRAERLDVRILFATSYSENGPELQAYPRAGGYGDSGLTDAQRAAMSADLDALTFDLPTLTPDEIRAQFVERLRSLGEYMGYLPQRDVPGQYSGGSRNMHVADAIDADTRAAAVDAATDAFRARLTDVLRRQATR
jgi:hypothetical protein